MGSSMGLASVLGSDSDCFLFGNSFASKLKGFESGLETLANSVTFARSVRMDEGQCNKEVAAKDDEKDDKVLEAETVEQGVLNL